MATMTTEARSVTSALKNVAAKTTGIFEGYDTKDQGIPLGGYAVLVGAYAASLGAFFTMATPKLPTRVRAADWLLLGVATHKLTRIVALDWVTSPLRAPFTRFEKSLGAAEISEKSRGNGLRRAIGDLVTCPYCTGPWVALGLTAGLVLRPRETRILAGIFSVVAISDWLHQAYAAAKKLAA